MIRLLKIMCLVVLIISCENNKIKKPVKPDNLISKNKMVDILFDMALLSSAKGSDRRILENKGIYPEEYVYSKHNIDSLQFAISNNYYSYDIQEYEELYEQVRARLESDKKEVDKIIAEEKKVKEEKDSIAKIKRKKRDSLRKLGKDENGRQIKEFLKKDRSRSPSKKADSSQISTYQQT